MLLFIWSSSIYLQSLGDLGDIGGHLSEPSEATVDGAALADAPLGAHLGGAPGAPPGLRAREHPRTQRHTHHPQSHCRGRKQRHLGPRYPIDLSCLLSWFIRSLSNQHDNPLCALWMHWLIINYRSMTFKMMGYNDILAPLVLFCSIVTTGVNDATVI